MVPAWIVVEAGYLTRLADALARPGKQRDLDAAAERGMAAVDLAESLASTVSADLLRGLYLDHMQPHGMDPAARDFMERARGFVAG